MNIKNFFDKNTGTFSYILIDESSKECAIIDSVLDFDLNTGRVDTHSADKLIKYIHENNLEIKYILETHIHADHLTAATYLQEKLGGKIAISKKIIDVLAHWVPIFDTAKDTSFKGEQFDILLEDGDILLLGNLKIKAIATPGHTPACMTYVIGNAAFVGDTIFEPNLGTARCDFPGGSSDLLYESIQKIFSLGDQTQLYLCHDYPGDNQEPIYKTTVAQQKDKNIFINRNIKKEDFMAKRESRDAKLKAPKLLLPSIQINMRSGKFGIKNKEKRSYIKIPIYR